MGAILPRRRGKNCRLAMTGISGILTARDMPAGRLNLSTGSFSIVSPAWRARGRTPRGCTAILATESFIRATLLFEGNEWSHGPNLVNRGAYRARRSRLVLDQSIDAAVAIPWLRLSLSVSIAVRRQKIRCLDNHSSYRLVLKDLEQVCRGGWI